MLKKLSTLWRFLLPLLALLILVPFILTSTQSKQQVQNVAHDADEQLKSFARLLKVSDTLVGEQVDSAMRLFIERTYELGQPSLAKDSVVLANNLLPNLLLGKAAAINQADLIHNINNTVGGTATLFVKSNDAFIRVATNVLTRDGKSAVGTQLDPYGKAIVMLKAGKPFKGVVDILGQPYITRYEPIFNAEKKVIGAWYIGYKIDMEVVRLAFENSKFLDSGFFALIDNKQHARFASKHKTIIEVENFLKKPRNDWSTFSQEIPSWNFQIVVAYPINEANTIAWNKTLVLFTQGVALALLVSGLIIWQLRRLIINPIGADPAIAIEVVKRIASGNLEKDSLKAKPGTLMGNVLTMRRKLRAMVETLRENSEKLALSANVVQHTPNGVFIADTNARIIEINPAFTEQTGYTREDAIGKTPEQLKFACEDKLFFKHIWQSKESAGDWRGETKNKHKNGNIYPAKLDLFVVRDEKKNIKHFVGVFADISETVEQRESLKHLAYHDTLTQLPNRALFADRLSQALAKSNRSKKLLAVCYFDLDDFKQVNDNLGHQAGDKLLIELADRLRLCLRESDTIARMGGDEFALLLCDLNTVDECKLSLDRLLKAINSTFIIDGHHAKVSASIGYTISPFDDSTPDTLLRHADQAMYQTKIAGGHGFHLFDTEQERDTRTMVQSRSKIEAAFTKKEFKLFYQPQIDMRHGSVLSFESLVRWQQSKNNIVLPDAFLPAIENTNLIIDLGEWAISESLNQLSIWHEQGLDTQVSVNIGARHLMHPDFASRMSILLAQFPKVSPQRLVLEITETAVIEDITKVSETMKSCIALGVTFALDDFGVGYSSLTYLRRLPVQHIKIDKSFVRDMLDDSEDLTLIAGIISLSREFGRQVIAEGVESPEQGLQLMRMGCHIAQGFGFSKAMEASLVPAWVENFKMDEQWKLWA